MSKTSDQYEKDVAQHLRSMNIDADRPRVSVKYSDIKVKISEISTWIEVKMNHTDNLGNTRISYVNGSWIAANPIDPLKKFAISSLTNSEQTNIFLEDIAEFSRKDYQNMIIPSTKGLLKHNNAVPYERVVEYFKDRPQYILSITDVDIGDLVTSHYLEAKKEPAHYMQAGDDFYRIGPTNPLGLPDDIPSLSGIKGNFRVRISIRSPKSRFYEIQPEVKISSMPNSKYSIKPNTSKENPFR